MCTPDSAKMLVILAPIMPADAAVNVVSLPALRLCAMPTPMPAPIIILAAVPIQDIILPTALLPMSVPICPIIVPAISVQNSPSAMPENASMR